MDWDSYAIDIHCVLDYLVKWFIVGKACWNSPHACSKKKSNPYCCLCFSKLPFDPFPIENQNSHPLSPSNAHTFFALTFTTTDFRKLVQSWAFHTSCYEDHIIFMRRQCASYHFFTNRFFFRRFFFSLSSRFSFSFHWIIVIRTGILIYTAMIVKPFVFLEKK